MRKHLREVLPELRMLINPEEKRLLGARHPFYWLGSFDIFFWLGDFGYRVPPEDLIER